MYTRLGLLHINFHQFVIELWPLIDFRISFLENKLIDFDQVLHMHLYWQDLGLDCYM